MWGFGELWPEPEGKSQGAFRLWVLFDVHKRVEAVGCRSVKCAFSTYPQWCLLSYFSIEWCHVSFKALSDAEVCGLCTRGKRQPESCKSGFFCKAFVCWVWEIKADSCNISVEDSAQTSKCFLFYLTECQCGHCTSWRQTACSASVENR